MCSKTLAPYNFFLHFTAPEVCPILVISLPTEGHPIMHKMLIDLLISDQHLYSISYYYTIIKFGKLFRFYFSGLLGSINE